VRGRDDALLTLGLLVVWHNGVMPRVCTVCASLERAEIDRRLSFQVCNVAALAREFGLNKDAMHAHRKNHSPAFLSTLQAQADALALSQLQAESQRLYRVTLDALAQAEAALLRRVGTTDSDTCEQRVEDVAPVSFMSVARMIREARAGLDQLVRFAADAPDLQGRRSKPADLELGDEIRKQLARVVARRAAKAVGEPLALDAAHTGEGVGGEEREPDQGRAGGGPSAPWTGDGTVERESPSDGRDPSPVVHQHRSFRATDPPACRRRRVRQ